MRGLVAVTAVLAAALGLGFRADTDDVTISAYPSINTVDKHVIVSGRVIPAKAGEYVAVQGKECGVPGAFFRSLWGASTNEVGGWEARFFLRTKTTLRAVYGEDVSPELTVQVRIPVYLAPMPGKPNRFRLAIAWGAPVPLRGKRVVVQRFNAATRKWLAVRSFPIPDNRTVEGFGLPVPKGTTVRAHIPLSQAKPCYLAGYSKLVRT